MPSWHMAGSRRHALPFHRYLQIPYAFRSRLGAIQLEQNYSLFVLFFIDTFEFVELEHNKNMLVVEFLCPMTTCLRCSTNRASRRQSGTVGRTGVCRQGCLLLGWLQMLAVLEAQVSISKSLLAGVRDVRLGYGFRFQAVALAHQDRGCVTEPDRAGPRDAESLPFERFPFIPADVPIPVQSRGFATPRDAPTSPA